MYIQWRFPVIIDYLGHVLGRANASPTTPLGPLGRAEDTAKGEHGPRGTPFPPKPNLFYITAYICVSRQPAGEEIWPEEYYIGTYLARAMYEETRI